jgi:hypothetical protein
VAVKRSYQEVFSSNTHLFDEHAGLDAHGGGEVGGVGEGEVAEPHGVEAVEAVAGAGVGEHLLGVGAHVRGGGEAAGLGEVEERVVGRGAPQEVGQAGGDLEVVEAKGVGLVGGEAEFDAVDELGGLQHGAEDHVDALVELAGLLAVELGEGGVGVDLGGGEGATEGAAAEGGDEGPHAVGVLRSGGGAAEDHRFAGGVGEGGGGEVAGEGLERVDERGGGESGG